MPKLPKWMADAMQSLFSGLYHPVTVSAVEQLGAHLLKIRFQGSFAKAKKEFIAGNVIEFRISDTEFRHYTPSYFNQKEGICEVLFFLHGNGPGSKWIANLKVGDEITLLGPGGKIKYNETSTNHIAFGDETSVGVFNCIERETQKRSHRFIGIAELDAENSNWSNILNLDFFSVAKSDTSKAAPAIEKLEGLIKEQNFGSGTTFYLTGNAKSIVAVKKFLIAKDFSTKQIATEPYWAEGKSGL